MALKISKKPHAAKAAISTEMKVSGKSVGEHVEEENPKLGQANIKKEDWCTVGFEVSYTHNLGNYQSARVQVSLAVPCPHAEISEIYDTAKAWVEERMESLIEELNSDKD